MKPILFPSNAFALPGGLRCVPREIPLDAWQAHLVKHPFGVGMLRSSRAWNHEGWDATVPPVITDAERSALVGRIQTIDAQGPTCGVREFRDARSPPRAKEPCYSCEPPLLPRCAALLNDATSVGPRYAAATETLLQQLEDGMEVGRAEVTGRVFGSLKNEAWIAAASILTVGLGGLKSAPMVRISRGDGMRADFYLSGQDLIWRTTYRAPQASVNTRVSFLMDQPAKLSSLPLSEHYVVGRGWWKSHGT